ncbi:MAG TPA: hypothetical protein PLK24_11130, partial [Atribacter sp.]|uniref:hypothetical protein n=1 Tax=Atribacter sp. TaxID=2847780 RepID=UPI002C840AA8
ANFLSISKKILCHQLSAYAINSDYINYKLSVRFFIITFFKKLNGRTQYSIIQIHPKPKSVIQNLHQLMQCLFLSFYFGKEQFKQFI